VLSTIIYVLLQLAFLGSIPTEMLTGGWAEVSKQFSLPYRDIAITLGMGWLAFMVISDAIISPSGTGNIYMNATPRVIYGWAKAGTSLKPLPISIKRPYSAPGAVADLRAVDFLDAAVPLMEQLAWCRRPGAELRHRPGDRRRAAPQRPGSAAAVPRARLRHHRPGVVYDLGADRLLVRLEYALVAAGAANRDVWVAAICNDSASRKVP
jgi:hypothetical protein